MRVRHKQTICYTWQFWNLQSIISCLWTNEKLQNWICAKQMHWLGDFDTSWVAFWEKQSWQVAVWGVFHHLFSTPKYWCPGKAHDSAYAFYTAQGKKYLPGGDKKWGPSFYSDMCSPFRTERARGEEGESRACRGQELPVAPRVGLGLDVGACDPGEQVEIWEAPDLQGRAWAALWAPSLANAIAWKAFQLSGSLWSSLFSSEGLSWMLLCALHYSGCSQ